MTTIAAIQGENFAVVAFDSMVSEGEDKTFSLPRSVPKVIRKRNMLVGAAGDLRAVNLLSSHDLAYPPTGLDGRELDLWVGKTFVPNLKMLFQESGYEKENEQGSTIILAVNCTIYEIGTSYEWLRDERGIYATGTGSGYAMGCLMGLGDEPFESLTSAKSSVVRAVEVAAELDPHTGGPVFVETLKRTSRKNT